MNTSLILLSLGAAAKDICLIYITLSAIITSVKEENKINKDSYLKQIREKWETDKEVDADIKKTQISEDERKFGKDFDEFEADLKRKNKTPLWGISTAIISVVIVDFTKNGLIAITFFLSWALILYLFMYRLFEVNKQSDALKAFPSNCLVKYHTAAAEKEKAKSLKIQHH